MSLFVRFKTFELEPNLFNTEDYRALRPRGSVVICGDNWVEVFDSIGAQASLQRAAPFIQASFKGYQAEFEQLLEAASKRSSQPVLDFTLPAMIPGLASAIDLEVTEEPGRLELLSADASYVLSVDGQSWDDLVHPDQRRQLKRQRKRGFVAEQTGAFYLPLAYKLIESNRAERGYPISISLADLQTAIKRIPEAYRTYLCYAPNHQPVGAAIVVCVNASTWYTFLLGHRSVVGASPVLSLIERIWQDARNEGVQNLDLGTAGPPGRQLPGLKRFKISLGANEYWKYTCRFRSS